MYHTSLIDSDFVVLECIFHIHIHTLWSCLLISNYMKATILSYSVGSRSFRNHIKGMSVYYYWIHVDMPNHTYLACTFDYRDKRIIYIQ